MKIKLGLLLVCATLLGAYQQLTVRNVYSVTPVTTSAFLEIITSAPSPTNWATVFDSSGQTLALYTGSVGQELMQTLIPPGGGELPFPCSAGSRVTLKAISGTASSGELDINFH
jgi:hypothetical protein